jgi:2,5-dihydroxypyridine 5,6-dioxygenase
MVNLEMLDGARNVVEHAADIRSGERVLILSDTPNAQMAEVLALAARLRTSDVSIGIMPLRQPYDREPPAPLAAAMGAADVVIAATRTSIYHTRARLEACKRGARVLAMTGAVPETLTRRGVKANFESLKPTVERVSAAIRRAERIQVTTAAGTNIRAIIQGRQVNAESGLCREPGVCVGMPSVEANVVPLKGSAVGRIVVDASAATIGLVSTPITIEVVDGRITQVTGGREARDLLARLTGATDEEVFNIAEFGIGLNPAGEVCGVLIEDESTQGTGHIGIGDNSTMGGETRAPLHLDVIFWHPTIVLDGHEIVMEHGQLRI